MSLAVDRILERRARREGRPEATSLAVALLLHAGAVAAVLLLPRLTPPPPPMTFVPVEIVPAQALGVRHPAAPSRPKAEKPKPEPEKPPEPEPEPPKPEPPAPKPKPVREEAPVLPDKPVKKPEKPKPSASGELPRPAAPADRKPVPRPPAPTPTQPSEGGETGPRGAPTGKPQGELGLRLADRRPRQPGLQIRLLHRPAAVGDRFEMGAPAAGLRRAGGDRLPHPARR